MTISEKQEFLKKVDSFWKEGMLGEAEVYLLNAYKDSVKSGDDSFALTTANELGGVYRVMTKYAEGEKILLDAIALGEKIGIEETPEQAKTYLNLATLIMASGDVDRASKLFDVASSIMKEAECDLYTKASFFNNISGMLLQKKEFEKALTYIEVALDILEYMEGMEDQKGVSLTTKAQIKARLSAFDAAIEDLNKAKESFESIPFPSISHLAIMYFTYGEIYVEKEQFTDAIAAYSKSKELIATLGNTRNLQMVEQKLNRITRYVNNMKK